MPPATSVSTSSNNASSSSYSNSASGSFSGPHLYLTSLYRDQYNNAIAQQASNYQNIMSGYGDVLRGIFGGPASGTTPATPGMANQINQGYGQLSNDVLQRIAGSEAGARQNIRDQYALQSGAADQQLINSGLGNTTVRSAVQRGVAADKAKADTALSGQMAQLGAGYQSQLGSAGLGALQQAMGLAGSLGSQYLGTLGGYRLPLPTWAPNYSASNSNAESSSQQQSTGSSTSTSLQGTDQQQAGPPQGLNAGTPGPMYTPGGLLGLANANNQAGGVSNSFNYNQGSPLGQYSSYLYHGF